MWNARQWKPARLGLPDVKPMQEQLLREMRDRMVANFRAMEPEIETGAVYW